MIQKLFLSFISDILQSLGGDFFNMPAQEKEKKVRDLTFDALDLLKISDEESLFTLTKQGLLALDHESTFEYEENPLLFAFNKYLRSSIVPIYDKLATTFFIESSQEKEAVLDQSFADSSNFSILFKLFLQHASNEEVSMLLTKIFKSSHPAGGIIIVQSARECSPELKFEVREKYGENNFVIFQVNTRLLGGLLIYQDSKISDTSWLGKVNALKQLTYKL